MFEPVELSWAGRDFTIPSDRVMGAIAVVEEVVTLAELAGMQETNKISLSKIAKAYASLLRYAGAQVTWEEAYKSMFTGGQQNAVAAVSVLLYMMIPPKSIDLGTSGTAPVGKKPAGRSSSRSRSKLRSAKVG